MTPWRRSALLVLLCAWPLAAAAQGPVRRVTTIDALRQFPGYFHLQNVLLQGRLVEDEGRWSLQSDQDLLPVVLGDGLGRSGDLEVRGQVIDVGRLEPGDPRLGPEAERTRDPWPRPGEEIFVRVTSVADAQAPPSPTVRALALHPWRYEGQTVTLVGNFRGRNLFADLPGAPGESAWDFVIRGAQGAVWVTGQRPRGRGFNLDIDRRIDTDQWLEVTGTVVRERGLVRIEAARLAAAEAPEVTEIVEEPDIPPPPPPPVEVVFSTPTEGEIDVSPDSVIRVQFSRGLSPDTIASGIRVGYVGPGAEPLPMFETRYDGGNRAVTIRFASPLERFRTVRVEILDGLKAFDGGLATPWTLTFSIGG